MLSVRRSSSSSVRAGDGSAGLWAAGVWGSIALALLLAGCGGEAAGEADGKPDTTFAPTPDVLITDGDGDLDSDVAVPDAIFKDSDQPLDVGPGSDADATGDDGGGGGDGGPDPDGAGDADIVDPLEDVPFDTPDAGCTPDCDGKSCGPDGCNSVCGFCEFGTACNDEWQCIPVCDPVTPCQLTGGKTKDCGPDGCGGFCGECDPSFACGDDGLCYESTCETQCGDKECGPDGCGGVCGTCAGAKLCELETGECVSNPCVDANVGEVTFKGACASATELVQCVDKALAVTDCTDSSPFFGCVWNAFLGQFECGKPPACLPDCIELGKQCGDGGCNYSCGTCFNGWSCEEFQCVPQQGADCGTIPTIGKCIANKKFFCSSPQTGNPQILVEDCEAQGKTCKFSTAQSKYTCQ